MSSKKFKNHRCAYCAQRDSTPTGDHIFAREFFLIKDRNDLPKVPCCVPCNNEKSRIEHYLTALLPFGGQHAQSLENITTLVPKRLEKNQKLQKELQHNQSRVVLIEGKNKTETMALPIREGAIESLFSYITRALVWYHWQTYVSNNCFVKATCVTEYGAEYFQNKFFSKNAANRVLVNLGNKTIIYEGVQGVDSPLVSAWRFRMYGGMMLAGDTANASTEIVSMTGPEGLGKNET